MPTFSTETAQLNYQIQGAEPSPSNPNQIQIIWAHGWARSHKDFLDLAAALGNSYTHYLIDFPAFGASPRPPLNWNTQDYTDLTAAWLKTLPQGKKIWIGHSFGCRIGLRLAANHQALIQKMLLLGAAGLRPKRSILYRIKIFFKVRAFKLAKLYYAKFNPQKLEELKNNSGSRDYRNAGELRQIFVNVVNEDLTNHAPKITAQTTFLVGAQDTEAPPEISQRFTAIMPNATTKVLPNVGHIDILSTSRYEITKQAKKLIESLK